MPGVPRSQRLLSYTWSAAGNSPAFVCPAGHVVLVKSLFLWAGTDAVQSVIAIAGAQAPSATIAFFVGDVPLSEAVVWNGWLVLNPTDSVYLYSDTSGLVAWLNGAVLAGSPPIPPAELADPLFIPTLPNAVG